MSALEVYSGNDQAPTDPAANQAFHQAILDKLYQDVRADYGWAGADFCWYRRQAGTVCIGIKAGEGWPGLEQLRAFRQSWTPPEAPEDFSFDQQDQGRLFA